MGSLLLPKMTARRLFGEKRRNFLAANILKKPSFIPEIRVKKGLRYPVFPDLCTGIL